jgi:hypothetical protein
MKQNEAHVKLMIYKYQGSLSEITSVLGITPSETHEDGDPSPGSVKRWQLDSSLDSSKDVEEHLDALLNQLAELKSSLETITSRSQAQINVAYYTVYRQEIPTPIECNFSAI